MKSSSGKKKAGTDKKPVADAGKELIRSQNLFPVVGIGASAGGLDAFKRLLKAIDPNSGMAYVLVQHLAPNHESMLPELLQKVTSIPVIEVTHDIKVQPDHIYVLPSNKMMVATDGVLLLAPRPGKDRNQHNLPIDLFFASLAEVHQEHAIGVILSGAASDGTQGLKAIKENGGITFAQEEATAEYESMPHSAIQAGVVDFILPPDDIPKKLLEVTSKAILTDEELQSLPRHDEDVFKQILSMLRIRKGTDFTYYKQTTIRRRILRRMLINKTEEPAGYLTFLRENSQEQDLLYQDMLIPVTSFFRDTKVFDDLCNNIFPAILKNKETGQVPRIWVAGCSTGQEVYSIAICIKEFLGEDHQRVQIFGSDLSEPAIIKARNGLYKNEEVENISSQRLKDYFIKTPDGYEIIKSIRDMCVFAHHNFLKDPPFGKMDCISCRNVLIYMEPYLQKKALATFHYALNPEGFLLLGKSETTGVVPDLFATVSKFDKLYSRKDVPGRFMPVASQRSEQMAGLVPENTRGQAIRTNFQKTADDILLTKYTPASVVVNDAMDIVHFRGNTSNFLDHAQGKPTYNLLALTKSGLGFELRNIIHKAKQDKITVVKENIPLKINGSLHNISLEAVPLPNMQEPYYLVLFHSGNVNQLDNLQTGRAKKLPAKIKEANDIQVKLLQQELAQAREDMRSITEDQEATNEELQSANEELLSGSEELQSLNEELETTKEEIQSTNEELTVLNNELINLNDQVTEAKNYAESIVRTVGQPLVVLDKNMRIKTANKAFYNTFKLNEQETEGILIYKLAGGEWNIPQLRNLLEQVLPQKIQITDFEVTHNFPGRGELTLLLNAIEILAEKNAEKLILLSIEDISSKKEVEKYLIRSTLRFRQLVQDLPAAVYSCDADGLINYYNDTAVKMWGREPVLGKEHWCGSFKMFKTDGSPLPHDSCPMAIALKEGRAIMGEEIIVERPDGSRSFIRVYPQPEFDTDGNVSGAINMGFDVTQHVLAQKRIEQSESSFRNLVEKAPYPICILKGEDMVLEVANEQVYKIWSVDKQALGKPFLEIIPEMKGQPFMGWLLDVYHKGVTLYGNEEPAFFLREDGEKESLYFNFVYQPYHEADGSVSGVMVLATDVTQQVTDRKKIEESEKHFRKLSDLMPAKISNAKPDGEVTYFNQEWLDFTGMNFETLKDFGYHNIMHPDELEDFSKRLAEAAGTGNNLVMEMRFKNKEGEYVWHLNIASPVKDEDGNIKMWVGVTTDITGQMEARKTFENSARELEEKVQQRTGQLINANEELQIKNGELFIAREKLVSEYARSLIEASLDPLITLSTHCKITDMNQATLNMTGLTRDRLTGTNFYEYFTESEKAKDICTEVFDKGTVTNWALTIRNTGGKLTDLLLNGSVYKDGKGKISGAVLVARDVTEEKRTAEELKDAIVLAEMAAGFAENARRIAEDAVQAKQQFLSNMSHEIRTPMNAIIGFTKVVLKTELSAKQREYLTAIKLSGSSLIVLINDILDLAKVDSGKMTFEQIPFKMSSSIAAMIHLFEIKIQEKNLALVKEYDERIPEVLLGDSVRLHQIILNLVSNAVKFTSSGTITISLKLINEDEENAVIEFLVADTGSGIAPDKIDKVFEKFHQASSDTARLHGGTGLGLAIVKQLVESQGGNIKVESKPGEGSVFSFTLSFKKTDMEAEVETEMQEIDAANQNIKVLVVEDIALNQLLMKTLLDDFGFGREIAANGKIAIEKLQEENYDVVLMDLQMPEMNGFEATEYIRKTMKSKVPIIALTADVTTVDLEKCKAVGMNDYIAKPVDEKILYSKIMALVKKPVGGVRNPVEEEVPAINIKTRFTDLAYLISITKYNHKLMMQMINMYLEQTPSLVNLMKKGLADKDWDMLRNGAHKMIPSFSIMGIDRSYEMMAKQVQLFKGEEDQLEAVTALVQELETICGIACAELKEEYLTLQNTKA